MGADSMCRSRLNRAPATTETDIDAASVVPCANLSTETKARINVAATAAWSSGDSAVVKGH
jgi:hypothetical protein